MTLIDPFFVPHLFSAGVVAALTAGWVAKTATLRRVLGEQVMSKVRWSLVLVSGLVAIYSIVCAVPYWNFCHEQSQQPVISVVIEGIRLQVMPGRRMHYYPVLTCALDQNGQKSTIVVLDFDDSRRSESRYTVGQNVDVQSSSDGSLFLLKDQKKYQVESNVETIFFGNGLAIVLNLWTLLQLVLPQRKGWFTKLVLKQAWLDDEEGEVAVDRMLHPKKKIEERQPGTGNRKEDRKEARKRKRQH